LTTHKFSWSVRVYYEDTDSGGVVYHSNYLNFMERARTEWLRALGYDQLAMKQEQGVIFVVHSMQLVFKKPAYFNDLLEVESHLEKIGHGSIEFKQKILRSGQLLIEAVVKVACVDASSFKPLGIPKGMKHRFSRLMHVVEG